MHSGPLDASLENYRLLVERVDALCAAIEENFRSAITCAAGCDGCCRHLSLFPVEAAALAAELGSLPLEIRRHLHGKAHAALPDAPCPLLENRRCLMYRVRPLICRTHGLPLLMNRDGSPKVDYCPLNFREISSLPGTAVIDLDRLNETLVAVNLRFVAADQSGVAWPERLTIAQALLLDGISS